MIALAWPALPQHLKKFSHSVKNWLNAVLSILASLDLPLYPQMGELHVLCNLIILNSGF